jgi:hypothetical protein
MVALAAEWPADSVLINPAVIKNSYLFMQVSLLLIHKHIIRCLCIMGNCNMQLLYKSRLVIVVLIFVIIGLFAYIQFDRIESAEIQQTIDLAIVDDLLREMKQAPAYRLLPESIMTGLCWYSDNGSREGIFKDINAGMSQWRERQPDAVIPESSMQSKSASEGSYLNLASALSELSFEATDYSVRDSTAEISGILKVAGHKQEIVLDFDLPVASLHTRQQEPVAVKAVTEIDLADLQIKQTGSKTGPVNLCLMMQVVRYFDSQPSSSERPMQLSQFY